MPLLRTVRVPEDLREIFARAEEVVARYFEARRDTPEQGTIEVFGERYVLVRAASLSVEFFDLVRDLFGAERRQEADDFARNILFDLAHAIGKADARSFCAKMGLEDPIERLSAGPVHFAHTGWASVDIDPGSVPGEGDDYTLVYDHPYSFESDAWREHGRGADFPVCIMNAGYSSGWCEESFGRPLVAAEVLCRARGDDCCRFVMGPPEHIEERLADYRAARPELARRMREVPVPDVFARKRLEDELRRARDELELRVAERTDELVAANARLQAEMAERERMERRLLQAQKLEALGGLAGGIAHDFNNILTAIHGYGELLLAEVPAGSSAARCALPITRAAERATGLAQQLLVFSRQKLLARRIVDVGSVVERMGDMLERLLGEDVRVVVDCSRDACVHADVSQLEQVVVNLAVNARDAMPTGGDLRIVVGTGRDVDLSDDVVPMAPPTEEAGTCSADDAAGATRAAERVPGESVTLTVRDSGEGMDDATLSQAFDPFFTTKGPGRGTGLGLSTVYGIVRQYGGSIAVDARPGEGASFSIRLPRVRGPADPLDAAPGAVPEAARAGTVLLAEDEDAVRELVAHVLRRQGYRVLVAADGAAAERLHASCDERVDLLLTDVVMPGLSGVELASALRARQGDLPVLFMSGYTDDRLGAHGMPHGATFIQKPFTLNQLEGRIAEVLAGGATG